MTELYDAVSESMPFEERKRYIDRKAAEIVAYAYKNSPGFQERLDRAGVKPSDIKSLKDLEKIPVLSKSELLNMQRAKPPFGGLLSTTTKSLKTVFVSPGPLYDAVDVPETMRILCKTFFAAGLRKGDVAINSFSYHLVPAGLLLHQGLQKLGVTVIPAGTGNSELQAQVMREMGVTCYVGTPSFLKTLIDRVKELGFEFQRDLKLKRAILTGEMLAPSLRQFFQNDYGIAVFQVYGTADLGVVAYECRQKAGMHIPEEVIVEIVDPATGKQLPSGETGELVVTSLNRIYPLVRFGTGDLSLFTDESCPCGRTSNRLVRIAGRIGDAVKVRGMFIHPRQLEEAISRTGGIRNFQLVVSRREQRDEMTLKLEVEDASADKERLIESLQSNVREICKLRIDSVDFVPCGTIPKERKIISDERKWE